MKEMEKNALNTVRLLTAMQVLYGHACTHLNIKMPEGISFLINFFMTNNCIFFIENMKNI